MCAICFFSMAKFADTVTIRIKAGDGGAGGLSFRREKYAPKGGPDGGDGGKGGDVIFTADRRYYNLAHFFKDRLYAARRGENGSSRNKHGGDGDNLLIPVPLGTQIIDADTDELLADLTIEGATYIAASGGIGGKGNAFFKSATHQTPRMAQPGMPGEELYVKLNLKLIADVGLVGLPNAGKSTLLAALTAAKPKIGDYPFTTLTPNIGVLAGDDWARPVFIADIPGIIEGAHKGLGLGLSFLQHIERVKAVLYLIDITEDEPTEVLNLLREELASYNKELLSRPYYVLLTKSDKLTEEEQAAKMQLFAEQSVLAISSVSGANIKEIGNIIIKLAEATVEPSRTY